MEGAEEKVLHEELQDTDTDKRESILSDIKREHLEKIASELTADEVERVESRLDDEERIAAENREEERETIEDVDLEELLAEQNIAPSEEEAIKSYDLSKQYRSNLPEREAQENVLDRNEYRSTARDEREYSSGHQEDTGPRGIGDAYTSTNRENSGSGLSTDILKNLYRR